MEGANQTWCGIPFHTQSKKAIKNVSHFGSGFGMIPDATATTNKKLIHNPISQEGEEYHFKSSSKPGTNNPELRNPITEGQKINKVNSLKVVGTHPTDSYLKFNDLHALNLRDPTIQRKRMVGNGMKSEIFNQSPPPSTQLTGHRRHKDESLTKPAVAKDVIFYKGCPAKREDPVVDKITNHSWKEYNKDLKQFGSSYRDQKMAYGNK